MPRRSPAALAVIAALVALAAAASLRVVAGAIADPPAHRVQFQADDGFYYLTLARHFATQGRWTFDGGVSLTTGFHLLHAYALASVFRLFRPGVEGFVRAALVLSWLALVPALAAAAVFCERSRSIPAALLVLVLLASRNTSLNAIGLMEWPWVVSIAACYVAAVAAFAARGSGAALAATAAFGFLASLARTDAGLLPAAILVGALVAGPLCGAEVRRWRVAAAAGLAGAVAGLGGVFVHNAIVSGQMVQSSVLMKRLWLAEQGWSIVPLYTRLVSLFGPVDRLTKGTCAIVGVGVAAAIGGSLRGRSARSAGTLAIWIGCVAAVVGYVAFYAINVTTFQPWYTANLVVPLFLAIALPLASVGPTSAPRSPRPPAWRCSLAASHSSMRGRSPIAWSIRSRRSSTKRASACCASRRRDASEASTRGSSATTRGARSSTSTGSSTTTSTRTPRATGWPTTSIARRFGISWSTRRRSIRR